MSHPLAVPARARFVGGFLVAALIAASASHGAVGAGGGIELNFENEELPVLVDYVGRATGEAYVFSDALKGRVTITVGHPVSRGEALAILDAALLLRGFAALRDGTGARKVLPIREAAAGAPWVSEVSGEPVALVTTLLRLDQVAAEEISAKLQHLVPETGSLIPYAPTNSLIFVGSESRVARLMGLAQALDAGEAAELIVKTLRHGTASTMSDVLMDIIEPKPGQQAVRVWADDRINSLLLKGSPDQLAEGRNVIERLDQPLESEGTIQVIRVRNRDAEDLAQLLVGMGSGRSVGEKGSEVGAALVGRDFYLVADSATNSLVLSADPSTARILREVVKELDREEPRILVEVFVFEISNPTSLRLGVDWFLPALSSSSPGDPTLTFTSNPSGGGLRGESGPDLTFFGRVSRPPLVVPFVDADGQMVDVVLPRETYVLTAEQREIRTRTLMRPKLLMSSGEEHEIFAGENVPIPVGSDAAPVFGGQQTNLQIERRDVGVTLRVTPSLGTHGKVRLDLHLEVSRVAPSLAGAVELVGPTLEKREVNSTVILADGELVVIGMSQQSSVDAQRSGTPFLQDIPILGGLMQASAERNVETHVVFAVQARILRSHAEDRAESIRARLALERSRSRVRGLRVDPAAPYAILVDTRSERDEAVAVVRGLERVSELFGVSAQVGAWKPGGSTRGDRDERYDVYLTGYRNLWLAGAESLRLRRLGYRPEVIVLPTQTRFEVAPFPAYAPPVSAPASGG